MSTARQLDMLFGDGVLGAPDQNRDLYVSLEAFIRFCAASGLCTIIASNNGAGAASGQGNVDYHEGTNPAGENAWILSRWGAGAGQPFYILIQWADGTTFGTAPGNPGLLRSGSGTDGIGIAMAVRDGGGDPWNGTSADDGTDTKGATVWTGADVRVFPRSNATGGNDVTNKENMAEFIDFSGAGTYHRVHFAADENCLYLIADESDNNSYLGFVCGHYTPHSGLAATLTTPYFMAADDSTGGFFASGPYGDIAGTLNEQGGICAIPASDVIVLQLAATNVGNFASSNQRMQLQPNNVRVGSVAEVASFTVLANEGADTGMAGQATSPFLGNHAGLPRNHVMLDENGFGRALIGVNIDASKHTFPWEGMAPTNGRTREGRQSFSA